MESDRPVEIGAHPQSRVRALGFDPDQLTLDEQVELLELHAAEEDLPPYPSRTPWRSISSGMRLMSNSIP